MVCHPATMTLVPSTSSRKFLWRRQSLHSCSVMSGVF